MSLSGAGMRHYVALVVKKIPGRLSGVAGTADTIEKELQTGYIIKYE